MFPLKEQKLIRGCQAHINAGLSCGADYRANYVPLYAPFPGKIETYWGNEGGNWLRLITDNGDRLEFAHLSKYNQTSGRVSMGEQIAVTGNTGSITSGPHLHIQIFRNGKRLDPEKYDWGSLLLKENDMHRTYKGTVYVLSAGFWIAIGTTGKEYLAEWQVNDFPPQMTEAQFKAFPLHKRTIK